MKDLAYYQAREDANAAVQRAKYQGRLPILSEVHLPCVDCGARATQYDHRDYSKPLKVEAVCHKCNARRGPAAWTKPVYQHEELVARGQVQPIADALEGVDPWTIAVDDFRKPQ